MKEFDQTMFFELGSRAGNDILLENAAVVGEAHVTRKLEAAGPVRLVGDYVFTTDSADVDTWYYCDGIKDGADGIRLSCIELDDTLNRTEKAWWIAPSILGVNR